MKDEEYELENPMYMPGKKEEKDEKEEEQSPVIQPKPEDMFIIKNLDTGETVDMRDKKVEELLPTTQNVQLTGTAWKETQAKIQY